MAAEAVLFDFENPAEAKDWTMLEPPESEFKEPAALVQATPAGATSGRSALMIIFAGGHLPAVSTKTLSVTDWMPYAVLRVDVTVDRPTVVGFRALQQKSARFTGWARQVTRWQKVVALKPGKTTVTGVLHPNEFSPLRADLGKVVAFDIFACDPAAGQTIFVDNIRLGTDLPAEFAPAPGIKTDLGVYPQPEPPKLPPAGGTIVDPTFGTTILRVTDETDGPSSTIAYSYWPTFNKDSTLFHLSSGGVAMLYRFDPKAFRILGKEPLFAKDPAFPGVGAFWEDSTWSGTDPKVLLCHAGPRLLAYNVETKKFTLIKDFSKDIPDQYLWQISRSTDDRVFGFTTKKNETYEETGCLVWRRDIDKIVLKQAAGALDEVQVDKTGRYCLIKTGQQGAGVIEARIVDLDTGKIEDLVDNEPDYSCGGHSDNGQGLVVAADNWRPATTFRRFATPHRHYMVMDAGSGHYSMLADDERWVLASLYGGEDAPPERWGTFAQEIYLMATDGSQRVRRLAHHFSAVKGYWDTPRANISRDGRFVAFTSNWARPGRFDVFILQVPDASKDR